MNEYATWIADTREEIGDMMIQSAEAVGSTDEAEFTSSTHLIVMDDVQVDMPAYLYARHIHATKEDFDELVLLRDRVARQNVTCLPFTAMKKALTFFTELRQSNQ